MTTFISIDLWWVGLVSYAICHFTHVLLWNKTSYQVGVKLLLILFFIIPTALYIGFYFTFGTAEDLFIPFLTHFILAANYISIYPAIQASSPTLTLLDELYQTPSGLTEKEILIRYSNEKLIGDRVQDLESGKFLIKTAKNIKLTQLGHLLAGFFIFFRKCLGLGTGAG